MGALRRNIPNIITCCNLICGCIATLHAFHHHFGTAFFFILLGATFDFFDGFTARLLKVSGPLGVELDSLADCVTFGVAPSAMIYVLFTEVPYPALIYSQPWFDYLPFTAFLLAAFSAFRLAKFNIDDRQHTGFLGMPTPACAIFWGALATGCEDFLCSPRFNAPFLLAFMLLFCFLLVSEVPMFALKFKGYGIHNRENLIRYGFLVFCVATLIVSGCIAPEGHVWQFLCRGTALCIGVYAALNIGLSFIPRREEGSAK